MKNIFGGALLGLALSAGPGLAADAGVEIGKLTCRSTEITNAIVFTETDFDCTFEGTDGASEAYHGEVSKIGVDLSIKENVTMVWGVLAPSADVYKAKALAGTYVGASADIAAGVGGGAGILIGGGGNSFTLQPLTVSGIEGAGAALGIQSFQLD